MKTLLAVLALALFVAGSASAVIDPHPNSLGLYFDLNADIWCVNSATVPVQAHLILVNPTFNALKGLECQLDWDETTCDFLGMTYPADCINVGDTHQIILGFGQPLPTTQATLVATLTFVPFGVVGFQLGGLYYPSIPGDYPVVIDGDDNMFQVGMSVPPEYYCAMINECYVIDAESTTWGGLKSLYR